MTTSTNGTDLLDEKGALFGMVRGTSKFNTNTAKTSLSAEDGLSNTVMFSEVVQTSNFDTISTQNGDGRGDTYRGGPGAFFSTYWEPNTRQPDNTGMGSSHCHYRAPGTNLDDFTGVRYPCRGRGDAITYLVFFSARSNHTGGVNATLGDGSVRFISDTIARNVWRPLGCTDSGEAVSVP
jgi:hypothetical protein